MAKPEPTLPAGAIGLKYSPRTGMPLEPNRNSRFMVIAGTRRLHMNCYSLAIAAVVLVGFAGAGRAELNEPPVDSAPVVQPAPQPHGARTAVASRRIHLRQREAIALAPRSCGDSLTCGQFVIGGIGF
jgi:hypothetical protein